MRTPHSPNTSAATCTQNSPVASLRKIIAPASPPRQHWFLRTALAISKPATAASASGESQYVAGGRSYARRVPASAPSRSAISTPCTCSATSAAPPAPVATMISATHSGSACASATSAMPSQAGSTQKRSTMGNERGQLATVSCQRSYISTRTRPRVS